MHPQAGSLPDPRPHKPLFSVLIFKRCERLDAAQVEHRLAALSGSRNGPFGITNLRASVARTDYLAAVERIRRYIAEGETY